MKHLIQTIKVQSKHDCRQGIDVAHIFSNLCQPDDVIRSNFFLIFFLQYTSAVSNMMNANE